MFIDEKIKEYIEHEKKEWQACKELWEKIKDEIKREKELHKYISTYENDFLHQELKKDFDKVLDNIESFANTFNFKTGIEISIFNAILIHEGYLSLICRYSYKEGIKDIKEFLDDKTLHAALKIFTGIGCCRHTASFGKLILDNFNIKNYEVETYGNTIGLDENLLQILRFLNDIHHKLICANKHNHMINYICENGLEFFADITYKNMALFYGNRGLAYNFNSIYSNAFPLYNYNCDGIKSFDFSKVPPLTKDQCLELDAIVNDNLSKFKMNHSLFLKFYLQNKEIYHNINEAYNGLYEEQKKLELIR